MSRRWHLGLGLLLAACVASPSGPELVGIDGQCHRPLRVGAGAVHVLVITSHECPIANGYAPTFAALVEQFRDQPVHWYFVHADPDLTTEAAREHAEAFALPGHVLLDPQHEVISRLGATVTPEAFVLTADGLGYRGRIDDQWKAVGARRPAASQHDLAAAIRSVLAGNPVSRPWPPAQGCLLPDHR